MTYLLFPKKNNEIIDDCTQKIEKIEIFGMGCTLATKILQSEFSDKWEVIVFDYIRFRTITSHQIFVYNSTIPIPIPIASRATPNARFPIRYAENPRTISKGGTPYATTFTTMSILYFPYSYSYLKNDVSESPNNCFSKQGIIESQKSIEREFALSKGANATTASNPHIFLSFNRTKKQRVLLLSGIGVPIQCAKQTIFSLNVSVSYITIYVLKFYQKNGVCRLKSFECIFEFFICDIPQPIFKNEITKGYWEFMKEKLNCTTPSIIHFMEMINYDYQ